MLRHLVVMLMISFHLLHGMDDFSSNVFDFASEKYIVVPIDILGLANRLRTLSSMYTIAKTTKRKLIVIWVPNVDCNIEFDDLFERRDGSFKVVRWRGEYSADAVRRVIRQINREFHVSVLFQVPRMFLVRTAFNLSVSEPTPADLVVYFTASSHAPESMLCDEYMHLKHQFYRSLQPAPSVLRVLREVGERFGFSRNIRHFSHGAWGESDDDDRGHENGPAGLGTPGNIIVGVHVRAHDHLFDWAVVPPISEVFAPDDVDSLFSPLHRRALSFEESTPLNVVTASMRSLLAQHPTARFFVASNSQSVKEKLLRQFSSDHIFSLLSQDDQSVSRNSTSGVQMALLEFYVLGLACDLIMHTKGSSFAAEAAFLHRNQPVALVDMVGVLPVQGGKQNHLDSKYIPLNVYKHDVRLRYCGMDEYFNAAVESAQDPRNQTVCYRDGAADGATDVRQLCTFRQPVSLCDWVHDFWGLINVYCLESQGNHNLIKGDTIAIDETICSKNDVFGNLGFVGDEIPQKTCVLTDSRGY